jgi:hypothetical protein
MLVAAVGDPGLTVVNPGTQSVLWNDKVTYERDEAGHKVVEATLRYGQAIALGNVAGQDLAVVVGSGTIEQETQSRPLLMVVSLFDPSNPIGLGYVLLEDATVADVILKDDLALLGGSRQVTLVSLTDKTRPKVLGTAPGVGGRLALGPDGSILFSTERSVFGGADIPLGGVRTAALGPFAIIKEVSPALVALDAEGRTREPITVKYRLFSPPDDITDGQLRLVRDQPSQPGTPSSVVANYLLQELADGSFSITVPEGVSMNVPSEEVEIRIVKPDQTTTAPHTTGIRTLILRSHSLTRGWCWQCPQRSRAFYPAALLAIRPKSW